MPMYDFECPKCLKRFEELVFEGDPTPPCPHCGCKDTQRLLSMPSPLKTGAFPFKVGPVNQNFVNRARMAEAGIKPTCSGCGGSCPHSAPSND